MQQPRSLVELSAKTIAKSFRRGVGVDSAANHLCPYLPRLCLNQVCQYVPLAPCDMAALHYRSRIGDRKRRSHSDIWWMYTVKFWHGPPSPPRWTLRPQDPNLAPGERWFKREGIVYRKRICNAQFDWYTRRQQARALAASSQS